MHHDPICITCAGQSGLRDGGLFVVTKGGCLGQFSLSVELTKNVQNIAMILSLISPIIKKKKKSLKFIQDSSYFSVHIL